MSEHVLTWRQQLILRTIRESIERRGYPPILMEIGEAVGLSSADSVRFQLSTLQREGYLTRGREPRSIRLTDKDLRVGEFFGYPREALAARTVLVSNIYADEALPLPQQVVGEGPMLVIKVHNDSMRGAAILADDLVVVRRETNVWDGIVVAIVDGVMVVRELDGDWLLPRHPDFLPRELGPGVSILGPVVSVLRKTH